MRLSLLFLFLPLFLLSACDRNNNINPISPEEDVMLGKQIHEELLSQPGQFPILTRNEAPERYRQVESIVHTILESGDVAYREAFPWEVHIIEDDEVMNAFATPGGHLYVYTGLLDFLDSEDELAGVLGHEIAHADLRHASRQLLKLYGLQLVMSVIFSGDEGGQAVGEAIGQITGNLAQLSFSREFEREADERSVAYLSKTPYACGAIASFFLKLQEEESGRIPEFLSTHPHPENRLANIRQLEEKYGCAPAARR